MLDLNHLKKFGFKLGRNVMLRDGFGKACHFYEFSAVHIMIVNLFEYNYGLNRFAFELQQGKKRWNLHKIYKSPME